MTTVTDEWGLLQRYALQRDEQAFEALARRYVDLVYGAAVRRVGDHHLAEDITQAVFVILAQKARSIRRGPPLSAWLLMTVRCVARNAMKREARRRRHEHAAESLAASAGGACSSNPSDVLIWQEIAAVLDDAVLRLPASDRRAILLRFFEGRSIGDVAADLNVSEGAVKQRLGRAIDRLRRRLERKGAVVGSVDAAAFAALLSKQVWVHAAVRLLGGIGATAATGAATGAGVTLAKGAIRMMKWTRIKMAAAMIAVTTVAGVGGAVTYTRAAVATGNTAPATNPATQGAPVQMNDLLEISVSHLFSTTQPTTIKKRVDSSGQIRLPYLGRLDVKGKTLLDIADTINQEYAQAYIIRDAKTRVIRIESGSAPSIRSGPIQSGDYLEFTMWGLRAGSEPTRKVLQVDAKGEIALPLLGKFKIKGMDANSAEVAIERAYKPYHDRNKIDAPVVCIRRISQSEIIDNALRE